MAKTAEAKKRSSGAWLNMNEPELFQKIRKTFEKRDMQGLPLAFMVRSMLEDGLKAYQANSVNMVDDPRLDEVRAIFERRGLGDMPLVAMVRKVLDEWIESQK